MEYYNITALNNELTKLENTKNNIKNSLMNKGQNIADDRPFSNYVENIDALGTVHQFNTKAEMNTTTNLPKGTLGIVYGEYKYSDANTIFTNSIYLPKNLDYTYNEIFNLGNNYTLGELEIDENNLYTRVSTYFDGSDMIIVVTVDGVDYNYVWLNGMWTRLDGDKGYKEVSISNSVSYRNYTTYVKEIIQIKDGNNLDGLYQYGNKWNIANTQLSLTADNAFGQPFWGKNGVEIGNLDVMKYGYDANNRESNFKQIHSTYQNKLRAIKNTLDFSNVTNFGDGRLSLNSYNFKGFENVTNAAQMFLFGGIDYVINSQNLQAQNVTNLYEFYSMYNYFGDVNFINANFCNVVNAKNAFQMWRGGDFKGRVKNVIFTNSNFVNVKDASWMFTFGNIDRFDIQNMQFGDVENISGMFNHIHGTRFSMQGFKLNATNVVGSFMSNILFDEVLSSSYLGTNIFFKNSVTNIDGLFGDVVFKGNLPSIVYENGFGSNITNMVAVCRNMNFFGSMGHFYINIDGSNLERLSSFGENSNRIGLNLQNSYKLTNIYNIFANSYNGDLFLYNCDFSNVTNRFDSYTSNARLNYIHGNNVVFKQSNCYGMFGRCNYIAFRDNVQFRGNITNASYMFYGANIGSNPMYCNISFENLSGCDNYTYMFMNRMFWEPLPQMFNVGDVTVDNINMAYMFRNCTMNNYRSRVIDMRGFPFGNVNNMAAMFSNVWMPTNGGIYMDKNLVMKGSMWSMFGGLNQYECASWNCLSASANMNSWDILNVTDMRHMFGDSNIGMLNICNWDFPDISVQGFLSNARVSNLSFVNCNKVNINSVKGSMATFMNNSIINQLTINNVTIADRDIVNVLNSYITSPTVVNYINISNFNVLNTDDTILNIYAKVLGSPSTIGLNLYNMDLSKVGCLNIENQGQNLQSINISNINLMPNYAELYIGPLGGTQSRLRDMYIGDIHTETLRLFFSATYTGLYKIGLCNLSINTWNVSLKNLQNLTTISLNNVYISDSSMFEMCKNCVSLYEISNLNLSNINTIVNGFENCSNLKEAHIKINNCVNGIDCISMFRNCTNLWNADINFDETSKIKSIAYMYDNCSNLVEIDISKYNISMVNNMSSMFGRCTMLSSVNLGNINVENVTNMSFMFNGCTNLQNIDTSNLNVSNVTSYMQMFSGCNSLSNASLDSIINMLLKINKVTGKTLYVNNVYSPFFGTNITNERYQNRWEELTAAGWTY